MKFINLWRVILLNKYISIITQVIGSSLKIIQTAAWDEIHIFLTSHID